MSPQRIGVMGGSFDPIHLGHLVAASEVAHRFALDRVIFTPTGDSWHKTTERSAPADLRYQMTVAATAGDDRFEVSRVDVDRPGPTYTIDTLRDLADEQEREHPGEPAQWFFITGADALDDILSWRDPEGIVAAATLVGVTRPGHRLADPGLPSARIELVEIPALAISSSDIRRRVFAGEPIDYLVPEGVARLIAQHHLYGQAGRG